MDNKTATKDIRTFYMMNGQVIFAEFVEFDADSDDYIIVNALAAQLGPQKQIAMQAAFPFTDMGEKIMLNWRNVTTSSPLAWNVQLMNEYDKFWQTMRAQAAGIVLPGQGTAAPGPSIQAGPNAAEIARSKGIQVLKS